MKRFVVVLLCAAVLSLTTEGAWAGENIKFTAEMGQVQPTRQVNGITEPLPPITLLTGDAVFDLQVQADGTTNPLFTGQTLQGDNPLFDNTAPPTSELLESDVAFLAITFGDLTRSPAGNGIVHRDLAARNVLLSTNQGNYSNDLEANNENWDFGADASTDATVGPIRWMAPESLRLYLDGNPNATDWVDVAPAFYFDSIPVPEPATALLLTLGLFTCMKRSR